MDRIVTNAIQYRRYAARADHGWLVRVGNSIRFEWNGTFCDNNDSGIDMVDDGDRDDRAQ
jgi:hypothetical protein